MIDESDRKLKEKADSLICCSICSDFYYDIESNKIPKQLDCGHTFCSDCLQKNLTAVNSQRLTSVSNFPCPMCRKICFVSRLGIDGLKTDSKMKIIIDLINDFDSTLKDSRSKYSNSQENYNIYCAYCLKNKLNKVGYSFCKKCNTVQCFNCYKLHLDSNLTKTHVQCVISSRENSIVEKKLSSNASKAENLTPRADQAPMEPTSIELKINELKKMANNINNVKSNLLKTSKDVEKAIKAAEDEAIKKIKDQANILIINLNKIKDENLSQIIDQDNKTNEKIRALQNLLTDGLKNKTSKKSDDIFKQKLEKELSTGVLNSISQKIIIFEPNINVSLGELKLSNNNVKCVSNDNIQKNDKNKINIYQSFRARKTKKSSSSSQLAPILAAEENSNIDNITDSDLSQATGINLTKANATDIRLEKESLIESLQKRIKSITTLRSNKGQDNISRNKISRTDWYLSNPDNVNKLLWKQQNLQKSRDCCFILDNRVVLVSNYGASEGANFLKAYDSTTGNSLILKYDLPSDLSKPWGVCYDSSKRKIYLSFHSGAAIKILGVSESNDNTLKKLENEGVLRLPKETLPSGITFHPEKGLFVADSNKEDSKICLVSKKEVSESNFECSADIQQTRYLAVNRKKQHIILTDCEDHFIKVFDMKSEEVLRFNSSSENRDMIPQGVVCDDSDNIFVCDQAIQGISVFNVNGELKSNVIQTIGMPWGLDICQSRNLLAVATDHGLEMYSIDCFK